MEAITTGSTWGPTFVKGMGPWLFDAAGKRYFDGTSGSGALSLGHQHPAVNAACHRQLDSLVHTGCKLGSDVRARLAERIASLTPFRNAAVLFSVIGTEAVESAIKIARAATGRRCIAGLRHAFHGKSREALNITWRSSFRQHSAIVDGDSLIVDAPYAQSNGGCAPALIDAALAGYRQTLANRRSDGSLPAALIMEPIQVTEGVFVLPKLFLEGMLAISREYGVVTILDEIYTGIGRCGALFFADDLAHPPDLLLIGKSLGNGLPISLVVGESELVNTLGPGVQTSTYSGHPLSCAAANAVLDVVQTEQLWEVAAATGARLRAALLSIQAHCSNVLAVRQHGMLLAFDLGHDATPSPALSKRFIQLALSNELLLFGGGSHDGCVKLVPPVLLCNADEQLLVDALTQTFSAFKREL